MYAFLTVLLVMICVAVIWAGKYIKNKSSECQAYIVIPISCDKEFEFRVRAVYWENAFTDPQLNKQILLVTDGKEDCTKARILAAKLPNVKIIKTDDLPHCISEAVSKVKR